MKVNVFEGARRIVRVIAVIWVAGWSIAAFTITPYVHAYFFVVSPVTPPIRMQDGKGCNTNDAREYLSVQTSKGTEVSLTLCFEPVVFENGKTLIPYRIDEATIDPAK